MKAAKYKTDGRGGRACTVTAVWSTFFTFFTRAQIQPEQTIRHYGGKCGDVLLITSR